MTQRQRIRILYVDDYPLDRELVRDVLTIESNEFELTEAASRADFETALAKGNFDLVLSDFNIAGFEGLQVLNRLHQINPEIPVIIVTGTGSEEIAVEAMKRGAADYVIKKFHHIQRLPLTIHAVLEKKRIEQEKRESEARYRSLFMSLSEGFAYHEVILDGQGQPVDYRFLEVNSTFENTTGLKSEQLVGRTVREVMPDIEDFWIETLGKVALTGLPTQFQYATKTLEKYYNVVAYSPEKYRFAVLFIDVTEQTRAEAQARALKTELEVHHRLIDLQEQEQVHIARELHDGPLQGFSALGFTLQQVVVDVAGQPVESPIRELQTRLRSEIDKLRSFTKELRSPVLYKFGLAKAIGSHLETFKEKHPELALWVETNLDDDAAPQSVRSGLFRIYQEALNNIVTHAHATRAEIQLTQTDHFLQLEIIDDGQGFTMPLDWLDMARGGHFGLVGMRERAEALGSHAEIISHPGGGTRVRVRVPL